MNGIIKYCPFCVWLISLSIMISRFILFHIRFIFLFMAEQYSIVCLYPSSVDGYLGGFHLLAIVNQSAVNAGVQVSVRVPDLNSFEYILRRIAGSCQTSIFILPAMFMLC